MNLFLLIAAGVGLVWGTWYILRGSLLAGCLAFLVSVCCFGYEFVHFDAGPLPLTVDRCILGLVCGAFIVQRRWGKAEPKPFTWVDGALVGLVAWLGISMLINGMAATRLKEASPLWRWIGGYSVPLVLYWIGRQSRLDERGIRLVRICLTGFGVYLACTALAETAGQWSLVFPAYIANPKVGLHFGRARGPMLHSVSFGLFLGISLLAGWLACQGGKRLSWLFLAAFAPLAMAGLYCSYTRSVWMGAALGLVIVLGLTLRGRARIVVLGGMLAGALLLSVTRLESLMSLNREGSSKNSLDSASMRACFAFVSWQMFLDRPLLGFGFGQFPTAKLPYLADRSSDLNLELIRNYVHHNTFLCLLSEAGLLGLGLFLAALCGLARGAWRLARSSLAPPWARSHGVLTLGALGVYAPQLLFHELSYTPFDNALVFFLCGVCVGLMPLADASRGRATRTPELAASPAVRLPIPRSA